ncbi:hypothetical protein [Ruania zhangjianzhongii]|uniref:hypothetical protein n=1 Tax=Ruania zhangjianzhongii TaxID=2603206 RepID=UPI0011CB8FCB|nr:hypothetical protein [Ruania zhangjianzhongii]
MTNQLDVPPTLWAAVRSAGRGLVRTWPRRIVLGVLVLVPALVAALGGFRTVELPPPPQLAAGESFDLGPAVVRAESFFVSDRVLTSFLPDEAQAWVGVIVDLDLGVDDEWRVPDEVFTIEGVADGGYEHAVLTSDDSLLDTLKPGVPQQVAVLFPVSDPDSVGDTVQFGLTALYEMRSFFEGTMRWWVEEEVSAYVDVPRDDEVPPALVEEEDS